MVDSNDFYESGCYQDAEVQIPLWSIVTGAYCPLCVLLFPVQIPLWSIVTSDEAVAHLTTPGSNSSMVDSNVCVPLSGAEGGGVQIPLWSIVTSPWRMINVFNIVFKFLYGR